MQREMDAIAVEAELTESKNGKPQVRMSFKLDDGSRFTHYASLSGGALQYTVEQMRTCGWDGRAFDDLSSFGQGKAVVLVVDDEEYEGKTRAKVKFINEPGKRGAPVKGGMLDELNARLAELAAPAGKPPF